MINPKLVTFNNIKQFILGVIKCITLTTLYMNSMWWPPNHSTGGMINQTVFLLLSSMTTFNYVLATLTGPGFLPKSWKPLVSKHVHSK